MTGNPYPGVAYARYDLTQPSARAHVVVVDLSSSALDLVATTEPDRGTTVSEFAARSGTQVVINGDFFDPDGFRPTGLARGANTDWALTADDASNGVVSFFRDAARVQLRISPPEVKIEALEAQVVGAVSGRPMLVRAGSPTGAADCTDLVALPCLRAPRTAIGRSSDGNTMYLVVVDGWQQGSLGMTAVELAAFVRGLGAHDALMLDGGSASSLHVGSMGGLVSSPSDGVARKVANHLAVRHGALPNGFLRGAVKERNFSGALVPATVTLDDGRTFAYQGVMNDDWEFDVAPRYACATATAPGYAPATQCRQIVSQQTVYGSIYIFPLSEVPDAGPLPPDAALPADAGPIDGADAAAPAGGDAGETGGGGGGQGSCQVASSPLGGAWIVLLIALVSAGRRRRQDRA